MTDARVRLVILILVLTVTLVGGYALLRRMRSVPARAVGLVVVACAAAYIASKGARLLVLEPLRGTLAFVISAVLALTVQLWLAKGRRGQWSR